MLEPYAQFAVCWIETRFESQLIRYANMQITIDDKLANDKLID